MAKQKLRTYRITDTVPRVIDGKTRRPGEPFESWQDLRAYGWIDCEEGPADPFEAVEDKPLAEASAEDLLVALRKATEAGSLDEVIPDHVIKHLARERGFIGGELPEAIPETWVEYVLSQVDPVEFVAALPSSAAQALANPLLDRLGSTYFIGLVDDDQFLVDARRRGMRLAQDFQSIVASGTLQRFDGLLIELAKATEDERLPFVTAQDLVRPLDVTARSRAELATSLRELFGLDYVSEEPTAADEPASDGEATG